VLPSRSPIAAIVFMLLYVLSLRWCVRVCGYVVWVNVGTSPHHILQFHPIKLLRFYSKQRKWLTELRVCVYVCALSLLYKIYFPVVATPVLHTTSIQFGLLLCCWCVPLPPLPSLTHSLNLLSTEIAKTNRNSFPLTFGTCWLIIAGGVFVMDFWI